MVLDPTVGGACDLSCKTRPALNDWKAETTKDDLGTDLIDG